MTAQELAELMKQPGDVVYEGVTYLTYYLPMSAEDAHDRGLRVLPGQKTILTRQNALGIVVVDPQPEGYLPVTADA